MIDHVYATGDQLRHAAGSDMPGMPLARDVVLAAMGGSGMAARVAALTVPGIRTVLHQGYGLPSWLDGSAPAPLLVAVSYSGNTEETLSAVDAAVDAGLGIVAVTTGGRLMERAENAGAPVVRVPPGLQPRAALASQAGLTVRVLAGAAGGDGDAPAELEKTAELVDSLLAGGDGPAATLGRDLGDGLYGKVALVYGGRGVAAVAASRWKAQINENAKMPAFASEIPEANHNEMEGWSALPEIGARSVGLVMLRNPGGHPRIERRMELTASTLSGSVDIIGDVIAQGSSDLDRFFSLAVVGDVAAVHLASIAGVDPTPVALLEGFKRQLKET
ncbi:MAG: SIS domain-containing protein [Acidimicrobiia bacterium]